MIIESDYFNHWKTQELCDLLSDHNAAIYPIRLWVHLLNRKTDTLQEASPRKVAAICKFRSPDRTAEAFLTAIIESGYFEYSDNDKSLKARGLREYNSTLFRNWDNGRRGGRPRKNAENPELTQEKPKDNPSKTQAKPRANPGLTQTKPEERRGEESSNITPIVPLSGDVRRVLSLTLKTQVRENRQLTRAEARAWDRIRVRPELSDEIALLDKFYRETKSPHHDETWNRKMAPDALMNQWETQLDLAGAFYAVGGSHSADRSTPPDVNSNRGWRA